MLLYISVYRPPSSRTYTFLEKLEKFLSKACIKYDSYIIMGDFNIDIENPEYLDFDELEKICDKFNLINLIR